jgi:hypothetical protein
VKGLWAGQPLFDVERGWGMFVTSVDRDPSTGLVHFLTGAAPVRVRTGGLLTREQAVAAGAAGPVARGAHVSVPGDVQVVSAAVEYDGLAAREVEDEDGDEL